MFSTDDEPISIILHVPSTSERQDYDQPGNVMLQTCYIILNSISKASYSLQKVARNYMSCSLLRNCTAILHPATDFRKL
jgi:hypothetical protein